MIRRVILITAALMTLLTLGVGAALAAPSPNGPGQPGATCGDPNASMTPGGSASAPGSAFNPNGTSGGVYAGSAGTASAAHANSANAVSQYDVACFQVSQP